MLLLIVARNLSGAELIKFKELGKLGTQAHRLGAKGSFGSTRLVQDTSRHSYRKAVGDLRRNRDDVDAARDASHAIVPAHSAVVLRRARAAEKASFASAVASSVRELTQATREDNEDLFISLRHAHVRPWT